jgi:hypothetical protein
LATFLARLNEIDIAVVIAMMRANFIIADHGVGYEELSVAARDSRTTTCSTRAVWTLSSATSRSSR